MIHEHEKLESEMVFKPKLYFLRAVCILGFIVSIIVFIIECNLALSPSDNTIPFPINILTILAFGSLAVFNVKTIIDIFRHKKLKRLQIWSLGIVNTVLIAWVFIYIFLILSLILMGFGGMGHEI